MTGKESIQNTGVIADKIETMYQAHRAERGEWLRVPYVERAIKLLREGRLEEAERALYLQADKLYDFPDIYEFITENLIDPFGSSPRD